MLDQALPIGINLTSPLTWFVIAVAAIVLALTVSTRRASAPARSDAGAAIAPSAAAARVRYTDEWTAAQALFVDDPRAGCERAQAIVTSAARDRGVLLQSSEPLAASYVRACDAMRNADAATDDLREAFKLFRAVFDALLTGEPDSFRLRQT